jgi:hypothetical protein
MSVISTVPPTPGDNSGIIPPTITPSTGMTGTNGMLPGMQMPAGMQMPPGMGPPGGNTPMQYQPSTLIMPQQIIEQRRIASGASTPAVNFNNNGQNGALATQFQQPNAFGGAGGILPPISQIIPGQGPALLQNGGQPLANGQPVQPNAANPEALNLAGMPTLPSMRSLGFRK